MISNIIPKHVAIIMDGNGRWAKERALSRTAGHREGIKRAREIIETAGKSGVKVLTLFAFSSENWSRPEKEIGVLMGYLDHFLDREVDKLAKNNVRFRVIGKEEPLSGRIRLKIKQAEEKTSANNGLQLVLALNYGSRQEIIEAAKKFAASVVNKDMDIGSLDEENFSSFLYTHDLPDPDLLIRTSGEMRLSNFLLWQLSYSEFYFPKKYWPDFKDRDFKAALREYEKRQRRFGNIRA